MKPDEVITADGLRWRGDERETATAPFTLGVIGVILGLPSIVFPIVAILALIGLPLSVIAYKSRKRLARVSIVLNTISLGLAVAGYFVVANAFN